MTKEEVVLDASVIVAAVSPKEDKHQESLDFLQTIHRERTNLVEPASFLLEVYCVLNRAPRELRTLGFMTKDDPIGMTLLPIGESQVQSLLAWISEALPGKAPTRGADLAYLSVARERGLPLVTLDTGLHQFKAAGVDVMYPRAFLGE